MYLEKATACNGNLIEAKDHYVIRHISNDGFRSYLNDRSQFVTINGFNSEYKNIRYSVP